MEGLIVRLIGLKINNLKNVVNGEIKFFSYSDAYSNAELSECDVNGIYGQNGSGKTAVINSIEIMQYLIRGESVPYEIFGEILNEDIGTELSYEFLIVNGKNKFKVIYTFELNTDKNDENKPDSKKHIYIRKESLNYKTKRIGWVDSKEYTFDNSVDINNEIPDYNNKEIIKSKDLLFENDNKLSNVAVISISNYKSLFFNSMFFINYLSEIINNADNANNVNKAQSLNNLKIILSVLSNYSKTSLQIIQSSQLGVIYSGATTLVNVHLKGDALITQGIFPLVYKGSFGIPKQLYDQIVKTIDIINRAIKALVPNIEIVIVKEREYTDSNGEQCEIKAYSIRNNKKISLQFESEGIKRIISILSCIVNVYKDHNYCLVIDELDSGIFEYLLGELVGILKENAKGQIIFTSHNLRILEKLKAKNIILTTINENNRYIKLKNVGNSNNIRDLYIRALQIGGQEEELYDSVNLDNLDFALKGAGEL